VGANFAQLATRPIGSDPSSPVTTAMGSKVSFVADDKIRIRLACRLSILKRPVPGGLVDGPIAAKTYNSLRGLRLNEADEFAEFQTAEVVYHDDVGDYSTNEPTMGGTADAILMLALWNRP